MEKIRRITRKFKQTISDDFPTNLRALSSDKTLKFDCGDVTNLCEHLIADNISVKAFYLLKCAVGMYKEADSMQALDQGSAGSWCSRAKFQVSKNFAGRSFSFSYI